MGTIFIGSYKQAQILPSAFERYGYPVVGLTPEAVAGAREIEIPCVHANESDDALAEILEVRFRQGIDRRLRTILQALDYYGSLKSILLRDSVKQMLCNLHKAQKIIDKFPGPWVFYTGGKWIERQSAEEASEGLFALIVGPPKTKIPQTERLIDRLMLFGVRQTLKRLSATRSILLVGKNAKDTSIKWTPLSGLEAECSAHFSKRVEMVRIVPTESYRSAARTLFSLMLRAIGRRPSSTAMVPIPLRYASFGGRQIECFRRDVFNINNRIPNWFNGYFDELIQNANTWSAFSSNVDYVIRDLDVRAFACYVPAGNQITTAIAVVCFQRDIPLINIIHGMHSVPGRVSGRAVNEEFLSLGNPYREITPCDRLNRLSQIVAFTPAAEEAWKLYIVRKRKYLKDSKFARLLEYPQETHKDQKIQIGGENARFRILYAGNARRLGSEVPLLWQTERQLCNAIEKFSLIVEDLQNVELTVLLKSKKGFQGDRVNQLFDKHKNVRILWSVPFQEELVRSDLVVSDRSTVIEETLYRRKPVILWTDTRRYTHLSGRAIAPSGLDDRGAVYDLNGVPDQMHAKFIEKIALWHRGEPLTDGELQDYIWFDRGKSWKNVLGNFVTND